MKNIQKAVLMKLILFSAFAHSAEIRVERIENDYTLVIEGEIKTGDFSTFINTIKSYQSTIPRVAIFSPGGNLGEAMKIGSAIRALELESHVPWLSEDGTGFCGDGSEFPIPRDPNNCLCGSACFFIHVGGIERQGNYLILHRPYYEKGMFGQLPENQAASLFAKLQTDAALYLKTMGVPAQLTDDLLATASTDAMLIPTETTQKYFTGPIPSRFEYLENKCGLSTLEKQEFELLAQTYGAKLTHNMALRGIELEIKKERVYPCKEIYKITSRANAFKNYFGVPASDLHGYKMKEWVNVDRFLRRKIGDIEMNSYRIADLEREMDPPGYGFRLFISSSYRNPDIGLLYRRSDGLVEKCEITQPKPSTKLASAIKTKLVQKFGPTPPLHKQEPTHYESGYVGTKEEYQWIIKPGSSSLKMNYWPYPVNGYIYIELAPFDGPPDGYEDTPTWENTTPVDAPFDGPPDGYEDGMPR